jgi:hypothetical protein
LNFSKNVLTYAALFCVGALTTVGCPEPELQNPSFRCNPKAGGSCPDGEFCCSDDPATVGGKTPNYYKDGVNDATYGVPLFSDLNNALSSQGMCVALGDFSSPLVTGCPVPCNPKWDQGRIAEICGTAQCCQTQELDPNKDCVMVGGRWRAAKGEDVLNKLSQWAGTHTTNQDPFIEGCKVFAGTDQPSLVDCVNQLGVADTRGFCYSLGCPCVEDLCDMKNPDYVFKCAGQAPTTAGM